MLLQELGDRHVPHQFRQDLAKAVGLRIRRLVSRERSILHSPSRPLNRQQRKSCLAQQAVRHWCLSMDEFGTAFRRVSELRNRNRMDAAAASVARFEYRDPL